MNRNNRIRFDPRSSAYRFLFPTAYHALLLVWVQMMIAVPIVRWVAGDAALPAVVTGSVLLQAAAVLAVLVGGWGRPRTAAVAALLLPLAWAVELLGSRTGLPFGSYHYTRLLQPQLLGVPLLIPLAWFMMLPVAWGVAALILGGRARPLPFALLAAAAFTAWDLYLDPQMVAWGYWVWDQPGAYFGIPLLNYAGWFAAAFALTLLARPLAGPPGLLPAVPLLVVYTITWVLQAVGLGLFWGMPGPALAGALGMGVFVWLGWRKPPPRPP